MSGLLISLILIGVGILMDRFWCGCVGRTRRADMVAAYVAGHEEGQADPEMRFGPDARMRAECWIDYEIAHGHLPARLAR